MAPASGPAMTIRDAWGFLSFGLVMGLLPVLAPSWFPPTTLDGGSGRALWLEVMGVVQTGLGGGRLLWEFAVPAIVRWLTYTPPALASVFPFETPMSNRRSAHASAAHAETETRVAA